jgi:hypothetical protein
LREDRLNHVRDRDYGTLAAGGEVPPWFRNAGKNSTIVNDSLLWERVDWTSSKILKRGRGERRLVRGGRYGMNGKWPGGLFHSIFVGV